MNYLKNLILIVLILQACGKEKTSDEHIANKLSFKINKALLGTQYKDEQLGIIFSPPLGCKQMPDETLDQARTKLEKLDFPIEGLSVNLKQFFLDKETGSACVLSQLAGLSQDSLGMRRLELYVGAFSNKFETADVSTAEFEHNGFLIHQVLVITKKTVTFKLVVPQTENDSLELSYIIPRQFYQKMVEAIESSIGSLKPLN